jgi:hypothetical protein
MEDEQDDVIELIDERLAMAEDKIIAAIEERIGSAAEPIGSVDTDALDTLGREMRTIHADTAKLLKKRERVGLAYVAGLLVAVVVGGGLAFAAMNAPATATTQGNDQSGGWAQYIWDKHGQEIQDCYSQAQANNRAVSCGFTVRP